MEPSERTRGMRKSPRPFVPVSGSATRAVTRKTSASAFGAEPLLTADAPGAARAPVVVAHRGCPHCVGADIGAALHFGEELRGGEVVVVVRVEEPGQVGRLLLGGAEVLQGPDGARITGERTVVARFSGLCRQIEQRQDEPVRRRCGRSGEGLARGARFPEGGHDAGAVDGPAGVAVARVMGDLGGESSDPVPVVEHRMIAGQVVLPGGSVQWSGGGPACGVQWLVRGP